MFILELIWVIIKGVAEGLLAAFKIVMKIVLVLLALVFGNFIMDLKRNNL